MCMLSVVAEYAGKWMAPGSVRNFRPEKAKILDALAALVAKSKAKK